MLLLYNVITNVRIKIFSTGYKITKLLKYFNKTETSQPAYGNGKAKLRSVFACVLASSLALKIVSVLLTGKIKFR